MTHRYTLRCALAMAVVLAALPVHAERPTWTPIAELLVGGLSESDPFRMSTVMTRCTALSMTMAGLVADYSPEMSTYYQNEALSLMQHAVLLDSNLERQLTGMDADIRALSSAIMVKVSDMLGGYNQWLDHNMATGETYFNKDFELEVDSCQLASKFVKHLSAQ
ncbi:MAG: hypothetical protein H6978_05160 [Gammaproteobacteria bacterium]|nr:hypothetical protein [Gammaproteobacteria bacterium]